MDALYLFSPAGAAIEYDVSEAAVRRAIRAGDIRVETVILGPSGTTSAHGLSPADMDKWVVRD